VKTNGEVGSCST